MRKRVTLEFDSISFKSGKSKLFSAFFGLIVLYLRGENSSTEALILFELLVLTSA
jgi:hypothetical protein